MTTTINNEHKKLNVPNLRFPEFQGEWAKCTLNEVCKFHNGRAYKQTELLAAGKYRVLRVGNFFTNDSWYYSNLELEDNKYAQNGDLLYAWSASFGPRFWREEKVIFHYHIWKIDSFKNVDKNFLYHFLDLDSAKIKNEVQGGTMVHITKGDMEKRTISYPSVLEQRNIARFLFLLDERIATQNKIIEDLKKLKSAIVEKVFCSPNQEYPMCRIEGFEQSLSTYKMSDFSSRIATKNKDSKCSLVLTIAAQYGLVNQESFFNKSVASENLTGYYLLHKGEFAYNRSYSAGYDWGTVKRLDNYDEGVLSTLYICFKINETIVDSDYLAYYFESTKWHRGLSDIAGEGARNHGLLNVSMADYFNTKHRFPVIEEQKAIAKILNAITEKERKATLLGECYQKQKQYLLCQMFT